MKFRPRIRYRHQVRSTSGVSYLPTQLAAFYGLGSKTAGTGRNVAVIELGGAFAQKDLDAYFRGLGLTVKPVVFHSVQGAQNTPDPEADAEVMLDLCVAGGVAPGAQLHCYAAPNTDSGFLAAINQAIADKSDAISNLLGRTRGPVGPLHGGVLRGSVRQGSRGRHHGHRGRGRQRVRRRGVRLARRLPRLLTPRGGVRRHLPAYPVPELGGRVERRH